jgi:hypothetical protein
VVFATLAKELLPDARFKMIGGDEWEKLFPPCSVAVIEPQGEA